MLGFCLLVITSLHITDKAEGTLIDEYTAVVAMLFAFSSIFSFISIRVGNSETEQKLEKIADYLFFAALAGILGIISFIIVAYWKI